VGTFFPEELTGSHLAKNFSVFYGTGRFITTFTKTPPVPNLSQFNPVYPPSYFLKVHFSFILQSTLPPSKRSTFHWSLHQNPVCISSVSETCYVPRPSHSSLREYLAKSTCQEAPLYVAFSNPVLT